MNPINRDGLRQRWLTFLALLGALLAVGVASAHVTVNPRVVAANSFAAFTVRVPTERDVPTTGVRIEFPAELTVSRFQPKPGWQREVEKNQAGAITAVSWSGGQIAPDEYDEFSFQARTPAEAGTLVFKAYQTYAGGETVAWIDGEEGEAPAPVVEVEAAASTAQAAGTVEDPAATTAAPGAAEGVQTEVTMASVAGGVPGGIAGETTSGGSDLPLFVALGSLVVAVLSLALSAVALARRRAA